MRTLFPWLKKILILLLVIMSYSCERNGIETQNLSTENLKEIFEIPKPKIHYSDSILRKVLDEELLLLKTDKQRSGSQNKSMTIDKSNVKKVYVHYLPWFQSKEYNGYWGQHWTMTNRNPDILDANGISKISLRYSVLRF